MNKKNGKLLVVSNMYPSVKYPHYGVFVQHTVETLQRAGYIIDVVSMKKNDGKLRKLFAYISFYMSVICKGLFGKYYGIYAHYASHTALPLLIISKFIKTPIVMNVHGNDVIPETRADEKYMQLVARILAKSAYVITPSEYFKKEVVERFNIPNGKIGVYPSGGINTSCFKRIARDTAIEHLNLSKNERYIGYVSRIEEKKGWDIFLKACSQIVNEYENVRLIIVGDGMQINDYNDLSEKLGLSKLIYKFELLPQSEIAYIFNALDVFVFPTYRKSESLGLVGLEAMSCETITVLPDDYGPASYGKDGVNSFMFKAGDENSLRDTIVKALNNEDESVKKNARETALQYNHENSDKIILNLLDRVFK